MKKFFVIFTLIFSFATFATSHTALRRSNGLLRFIAQQHGMRNAALASVINTRCSRYMNPEERRPCKEAVKKMLVLLDYDVIFDEQFKHTDEREWTPSSFVFVAFKGKLTSLLSQDKTTSYLNDLNQELYKYLTREKSDLNVWSVTKKYFGTDAQSAMAMAALFQDTSVMKLHIAYLQKEQVRRPANFVSNMELLSRVIDTINLILDSSEEHYRKLFYPAEIQKNLNRNIYHFYVPLYLSKALASDNVHKDYAFKAVLMLTLSYEFITSARDYRFLFDDPSVIDNEHKVKDIFGGYCGSNLGVNGTTFNKNFTLIRETFSRSTEEGVNLLLKR